MIAGSLCVAYGAGSHAGCPVQEGLVCAVGLTCTTVSGDHVTGCTVRVTGYTDTRIRGRSILVKTGLIAYRTTKFIPTRTGRTVIDRTIKTSTTRNMTSPQQEHILLDPPRLLLYIRRTEHKLDPVQITMQKLHIQFHIPLVRSTPTTQQFSSRVRGYILPDRLRGGIQLP